MCGGPNYSYSGAFRGESALSQGGGGSINSRLPAFVSAKCHQIFQHYNIGDLNMGQYSQSLKNRIFSSQDFCRQKDTDSTCFIFLFFLVKKKWILKGVDFVSAMSFGKYESMVPVLILRKALL